jgi:hypothetical protein
MPILTLVIWLALLGLLVWLVTTYIPMPEPIKRLIVIVVVVLVVLWIVQLVGFIGPSVPRLR